MIELLFSISGTIAVSAGTAQVYQLVKIGRSDEMSLPTWSLWFTTQMISLSYALSISEPVLIFVNTMWVVLYGIMMSLILYYRRYPRIETVKTREQIVRS